MSPYGQKGKLVPAHHEDVIRESLSLDMARPQVAGRGTASKMEGSCEYVE